MSVTIRSTSEPAVKLHIHGPLHAPTRIVFVHELAGWLAKAVIVPIAPGTVSTIDVVIRSLTAGRNPELSSHLETLEPAARETLLEEIASIQRRVTAALLLHLASKGTIRRRIEQRPTTQEEDAAKE